MFFITATSYEYEFGMVYFVVGFFLFVFLEVIRPFLLGLRVKSAYLEVVVFFIGATCYLRFDACFAMCNKRITFFWCSAPRAPKQVQQFERAVCFHCICLWRQVK